MPYHIPHNYKTYIMKNPFNPFDKGEEISSKNESSMLIDGLRSVSQSFFIWRFIFYYFIFKNNHKNIYNNIN